MVKTLLFISLSALVSVCHKVSNGVKCNSIEEENRHKTVFLVHYGVKSPGALFRMYFTCVHYALPIGPIREICCDGSLLAEINSGEVRVYLLKANDRLRLIKFLDDCDKIPEVDFDSQPHPFHGKALSDKYISSQVEEGVYDWWLAKGYFNVKGSLQRTEGRSYHLIAPPPNVTGNLHLGHALSGSLQDVLVRWRRMIGDNVMWIPGTDHAGIGTQAVVEKNLLKSKGTTRETLGRARFIEATWEWTRSRQSRITTQLRQMGFSFDWSREFFTLDAGHSANVNKVFVRLFDEGLIHRDTRMINWCCHLKTAISDIEVEARTVTSKTYHKLPNGRKVAIGQIYNLAYPVVGGQGLEVVIATTRPETIPGDVAIAIHPEDSRYVHLHGQAVQHPLTGQHLPIILDSILVDREKGTGAVKVTPSHDSNDQACGRRHNLPMAPIMSEEGNLLDSVAVTAGLQRRNRFDVRTEVLEVLKAKGLYRGVQDHAMTVPVCTRSGDILESMLVPQWFLSCASLAKRATDLMTTTSLQLVPSSQYSSDWNTFMSEYPKRDWCISRQLWWGHRIPVYRIKLEGYSPEVWVSAEAPDQVEAKIALKLSQLGLTGTPYKVDQDNDVLDTWFSAALLPLTVTGWDTTPGPESPSYPMELIETGYDILYFWVARMTMLCSYVTGQLPFRAIYLHPMVRDSEGRKMSKSLGNVIDPLDLIHGTPLDALKRKIADSNLDNTEKRRAIKNIVKTHPQGLPACGTDAVRLTLCDAMHHTRTISMDVDKAMFNQRLCNKIWQMMRFSLKAWGTVDMQATPSSAVNQALSLESRWIRSRLASTILTCDKALCNFNIGIATNALISFLRLELCDVYLEAIKPTVCQVSPDSRAIPEQLWVLHDVVETTLRLLHPFLPYLSEALWQVLPVRRGLGESIMIAPYPTPETYRGWKDEEIEKDMQVLLNVTRGVRDFCQLCNTTPNKLAIIACMPNNWIDRLQANKSLAVALARINSLSFAMEDTVLSPNHVRYVIGSGVVLHIPLQSTGTEMTKVTARMEKKQQDLNKRIVKLISLINAPDYKVRNDAATQAKSIETLHQLQDDLEKVVNVVESCRREGTGGT